MKWKEELVRFIKFNAVGIVNSLVDWLIYTLLSGLGLAIAPAQTISYCAGMLNSWLMNSRWTFKDKNGSPKRIIGFVIVNLVSLGVSIGVLYLLKNFWGLEGGLAKLISLPFSVGINFLGNRLFVFKNKQ